MTPKITHNRARKTMGLSCVNANAIDKQYPNIVRLIREAVEMNLIIVFFDGHTEITPFNVLLIISWTLFKLSINSKKMWYYNGEILENVPEGMEGFVYIIENLTNNKKYIGKKHFWERRKDPKTGRRKTKEGNWKKYFGSCDELIQDHKELGDDKFVKTILYLCPHKKSMSYFETLEQFKRDVIMSEDYYNTNVEGKFFTSEIDNIYSKVLISESVQRNLLQD